jgi:ribosomal protein S20
MIYKRLILLLITQIMENKQALKLIEKIQKDLLQNKFEVSKIVEELKKIREISLELNNPVVTKALRLAYEHLDTNNAFLIGIPDDEPVDSKEVEFEANISDENNIESFNYFLSLFTDLNKKNNVLDLKEYNKAFIAF